ncbi:serine hydrolase [Brevibacillus choshinensis]|uniref:Serine hydrolase n=1 Tax=Brevibacillus choshinensis TaxID=54911 RepID=A0ABR5N2F2_BRECH|nr:serine hydrolase [Brevibacillus choshinensis]KQL44603.1 serine hydrolase [Brevibacillus choshinensis]
MDLQKKIEELVGQATATFGIVIKHLETNEEVKINEGHLFQMASCYKVPILATLFREVEAGTIDLNTRVRLSLTDRVPGSGVLKEFDPGSEVSLKDLATLMIIVSDNVGTDKILELVGVNHTDQYMKSIGLQDTYVNLTCWQLLSLVVNLDPELHSNEQYEEVSLRLFQAKHDKRSIVFTKSIENNVSTPADMALLLEKIARKELISKKACEQMIDIMKRQHFRDRIPNLLPAGTPVACKSGSVGGVHNDIGIIYLPEEKGTVIVSAFSENNSSQLEAAQMIAKVAQSAYDYFVTR